MGLPSYVYYKNISKWSFNSVTLLSFFYTLVPEVDLVKNILHGTNQWGKR